MNIIVYSPDYLNALYLESGPYTFKFQGYGDIEKACVGLGRTNISEILGFVMVSDKLPQDTTALERFLYKCNLIAGDTKVRRRFVFGLRESEGLVTMLKKGKYQNLDFYSSDFDILTDSFLRKDIFGTVLESHLKPYSFTDTSVSALRGGLPLLKVVPLFPMPVTRVTSEIVKRETIRSTEVEDPILSEDKSLSEFYILLRRLAIRQAFGEPTSDLKEKIEELLEKDTSLESQLLYTYVKEERVSVRDPIVRLELVSENQSVI